MKTSENDPLLAHPRPAPRSASVADVSSPGPSRDPTRDPGPGPGVVQCKTQRFVTRYVSCITLLLLCSSALLRSAVQQRPQPAMTMSPIASESAPRERRIGLFSLNAFIRPVLVGISDHKDSRLHDLEAALSAYDIACFQELFWTSGPRKQAFLHTIAQSGLTHVASPPTPGLRGLLQFPPKIIDAGLVIASRFAIARTDYVPFHDASYQSIDFLVAKGVLYARLILPHSLGFLHVFTTHLQANNGLEVAFDETRRSQLAQLVQFVQRVTQDDPSGPVVLAGDFNVDGRMGPKDSSSSDEYVRAAEILAQIRPSVPLKDIVFEAYGHTHPVTSAGGLYGRDQKNERLDYIFLSSPHGNVVPVKKSVRVDEMFVEGRVYRTISDHYALEAYFNLK